MKNKAVDAYIKNAPDFSKPILEHLRELVHKACPDIEEQIKWGSPFFDYNGTVCNMSAFKNHTGFGFWKMSLMKDPKKLFGNKMEAAGSIGKITELKQLPSDKILIAYIKEAVELNKSGAKVVVRKNPTVKISVPAYLKKELAKNKKASAYFDSLSPSHRKEYLEWITGAKTEATREKRIAKMLLMLADAKHFHWKYEPDKK
jgi:uncharacterized protein YdeI (YjbR/CyaY-like superfamily)